MSEHVFADGKCARCGFQDVLGANDFPCELEIARHQQHCSECGEDYDRRALGAVIFHSGDHSLERGVTGIVGERIYTYGFYLFHEPDAPNSLKKLVAMISSRFEWDFSPEEFRQFRDSLSASGIALKEIERFNPIVPEVVL